MASSMKQSTTAAAMASSNLAIANAQQHQSLTNSLWQQQAKAHAELLALTYGALIGELWRDLETPEAMQAELDRMGHSMGLRCMEELLAKVQSSNNNNSFVMPTSFLDTAAIIKMAYKVFWGVNIDVTTDDTSMCYTVSIGLDSNPLTLFVELPTELRSFEYIQLWCGMIRGMLEVWQYQVDVQVTSSPLKQETTDTFQLAVTLKTIVKEGAGEDYQEE